jgi:hypothetical protein
MITDDSQMTLFTAEGLLRAWVRGYLKRITTYSGVTAHAYLRWLQTQDERPTCDYFSTNDETGWLFEQKALHSRRAPGMTCLFALKAMKAFGEPARKTARDVAASCAISGPLDRECSAQGRVEQSFLRKGLFRGAETSSCSLCGQLLPIELLVAAHIKPRSECSRQERLVFPVSTSWTV